jgi:cupin 2 domain-containing protein
LDAMCGIKNLFAKIPDFVPQEVIEVLLKTDTFRLERIISHGQATAAGEWLHQVADEWVLLLKGSAGLRFEGDSEMHIMRPGDSLYIPAHLRHRVEWTESAGKTVWLALHYKGKKKRKLKKERDR